MSNLDRIGALFEAVGPLDPQISGIVSDGPERWVVGYPGASVVAEYDAERDCLVLSGDLGTPPADRAHDVHAIMLRYNLLRRETGGVVTALDGEGEGHLLVDLPADGLDERTFAGMLENMCAKMLVWRTIVVTGLEPVSAEPLNEFAVRI